MDTRSVKILATVLVAICALASATVTIAVLNDNNGPDRSTPPLSGVNDGDGFGLQFSADQDDAYTILKLAIDPLNADNFTMLGGDLSDLLKKVQENKTFDDYKKDFGESAVPMYHVDATANATVSSVDGDRTVEMKGVLKGGVKLLVDQDGDTPRGFPEGEFPHVDFDADIDVKFDILVVVHDDIVTSVSYAAEYGFGLVDKVNYEFAHDYNGSYLDYIAEPAVSTLDVKLDSVGRVTLTGVDNVSAIQRYLMDPETEDHMTVDIQSVTTLVGGEDSHDTPVNHVSGYGAQIATVRSMEIPAGFGSMLLNYTGLDSESLVLIKDTLTAISENGLTYEAANPVLTAFGIDLTEEQFDILVSVKDSKELPPYEVIQPLLTMVPVPVEPEMYSLVSTLFDVANGDLSYENLAVVFLLVGAELTPEQYDALKESVENGKLPAYETVENILVKVPVPVEKEMYDFLSGAVNAYIDDPSYENFTPFLNFIPLQITEEQYAAIFEVYDGMQDGLSAEELYKILSAYGLPVDLIQCQLIVDLIYEHEIPAYEQIQPLFENFGLPVTKEMYENVVRGVKLVSTFPGYFSMEYLMENVFGNNTFVSEEVFTDSATFLRSYFNGFKELIGSNCTSYIKLGDLSVGADNRAAIDSRLAGLTVSRTVQKWVDADEYGLAYEMKQNVAYISDFYCPTEGVALTDTVNGYKLYAPWNDGYFNYVDGNVAYNTYVSSTGVWNADTQKYDPVYINKASAVSVLDDGKTTDIVIPDVLVINGVEYTTVLRGGFFIPEGVTVSVGNIDMYTLGSVHGYGKLVVRSMPTGYDRYFKANPDLEIEFAETINGMVLVSDSGTYDRYTPATLLGYYGDAETLDLSKPVIADGKRYIVTSVNLVGNTGVKKLVVDPTTLLMSVKGVESIEFTGYGGFIDEISNYDSLKDVSNVVYSEQMWYKVRDLDLESLKFASKDLDTDYGFSYHFPVGNDALPFGGSVYYDVSGPVNYYSYSYDYRSAYGNLLVPKSVMNELVSRNVETCCYGVNGVFLDGEVIPYDIQFFDVNAVHEMAHKITVNGNIGRIVSSWWSHTVASNLDTVVFNGDVARIDSDSFHDCLFLSDVTFNGNVGVINGMAFQNTEKLSKLTFNAEIGYIMSANVDASLIGLGENAVINTVYNNSVIIDVAGDDGIALYDAIIKKTVNADYNAFVLGPSVDDRSVYAVSAGVNFGDYVLFKRDGKVYAYGTYYSGMPSSILIDELNQTIPLGMIDANGNGGVLTIPEGVEIRNFSGHFSDATSESRFVNVVGINGGVKTLMNADGRMIGIVGSGSEYLVPEMLDISYRNLASFLRMHEFTKVSAQGNNAHITVVDKDGYYSVVCDGVLVYVCGSGNAEKAYELPAEVNTFYVNMYPVYTSTTSPEYVLGDLGLRSISVNEGNRHYTAFAKDGYSTLLYGSNVCLILGSGDVYCIPAAADGDFSSKIDLKGKSVDASLNDRYKVVESGDYATLLYRDYSIIHIWKTGDTNVYIVPDQITSFSLDKVNGLGIDTLHTNKVTYLYDALSDATVDKLYIESPQTSAGFSIRTSLSVLEIPEDLEAGTYVKTDSGIHQQYVNHVLIFAKVIDNSITSKILNVDNGTVNVNVWGVTFDAASVPGTFRTNNGYSNHLSTRNLIYPDSSNYYTLSFGMYSSDCKIMISGGHKYPDAYPVIEITSVDGYTVNFKATTAVPYTFSNGKTVSEHTVVTNETDTYGLVLSLPTHTITVDLQNKVLEPVDPFEINCYQNVKTYLPTPSRSGYEFGGWYLDKDCTTRAPSTGYTSDCTLYAKWLKYCTVVIYDEKGEPVPDYRGEVTRTVLEGDSLNFDSYQYGKKAAFVTKDGEIITSDTPITCDMELSIIYLDTHYVYIQGFEGGYGFDTIDGQPLVLGTRMYAPSGVRLVGLYMDRFLTEEYDMNAPVTESLHLYAKYVLVSSSLARETNVLITDNGYYRLAMADKMIVDGNRVEFYSENSNYNSLYAYNYSEYRFVGFVIEGQEGVLADGTHPVSGPITVRALYEPRTVTVTYSVDKTKGTCDVSTETIRIGGHAALPDVTPAEGYRFVGWVTGFTVHHDLSVYEDVTLYAAFVRTSVEEFTLTFECENGDLTYDSEIRHELDIVTSLPEVILFEGQEFVGWFVGDVPVSLPFLVKSDMTLTAVVLNPGYTVVFIDDGKEVLTYEIEADGEIVYPDYTPAKESTAQYTFTFKDWELTESRGKLTYTAAYTETLRSYTVTFTVDGVSDSKVMDYGDLVILPEKTPVKEMDDSKTYTFLGWEGYTEGMTVTGDLTFTPVFEGEDRLYTVTFTNGEGTFATADLKFGDVIALPENTPAKESTAQYDFTFKGWEGYTEGMKVNGAVTFTAVFDSVTREYTVSFLLEDDTVFESRTLAYGSAVTAPAKSPAKEMDDYNTYTFRTWTGLTKDTTVTGDMNFKAEFAEHERQYTVEFYSENTKIWSYTAGFGKNVTLPAEKPVKAPTSTTVYTFAGWNGYTEGMTVSGNARFDAVFTDSVREYTVSFTADGYSVTQKYHFQDVITAPETDPVRESTYKYVFTFIGWQGYTEGMKVAADYTFEAMFLTTGHPYTLTFLMDDGETVFATIETAYGKLLILPEQIPAKEADGNRTYAFSEWKDFTAGTVTGDATFTAVFQVGEQKVDEEKGTVTTTVETENGGTKVTVYEKDGSSTSVETEKTEAVETDKDGHDVAVSTETKTQTNTNIFGESTTTVVKDTSSESDVQVKNESVQVDKDKNGVETSTSKTVDIESKEFDIKTTAQSTTGKAGNTSEIQTVIENTADQNGTTAVGDEHIDVALKQMDEAVETVGETVNRNLEIVSKNTEDRSGTVISTDALSKISEKDVTLDVKSSVGTISFGADITRNLSEVDSGDVALGIAKVETSNLTEAQKRVVKDNTVIQLTATVGETAVHMLGGWATITVPYDLKPHENPNNIKVWFVDDEGHFYLRETVYDPASGTITFQTEHFSYYVIAQEQDLGKVDTGADLTIVMIAASVVAILVIASVAVMVGKRRKF